MQACRSIPRQSSSPPPRNLRRPPNPLQKSPRDALTKYMRGGGAENDITVSHQQHLHHRQLRGRCFDARARWA